MPRLIDADKLIKHLEDEIAECEENYDSSHLPDIIRGSSTVTKAIAKGTKLGLKSAIAFATTLAEIQAINEVGQSSKDNSVRCIECKHLMFSDCYGECSQGYKGIVRPNDSCGRGEPKG